VTRRRFALLVGLAAFAGLALRIAYILIERRHDDYWGDAWGYHRGAVLLADGHGFIDGFRYDISGGVERESAIHPPLYMLYLTAWSVVGLDGPLQHRIVSAFLGVATVVVVALVAKRLAGPRAGVAAAILAALYPNLWINDALLLSESMAALTVALSLLAIERYRERPDLARAAQMGGAFALAALTRAELLLFFPLIAIPLLLVLGPKDARSRLVRLTATATAGLLLIGPWVAYNMTRFEEPVTISNGLGSSMLGGSCDDAWYGSLIGYVSSLCPSLDVGEPPDAATQARWAADPEGSRDEIQAYVAASIEQELDESERDVEARELAFEYIGDHQRRLPLVVAARVGRVWNLFRPAQNIRLDAHGEERGLLEARLAMAGYFALMGLAIAGLVKLRRGGRPIWPYLVIAGIVTFTAAITFGIQRYRIPVDTALPVLAGAVFGTVRPVHEPKPDPDPA
jgi:hypothetical protein